MYAKSDSIKLLRLIYYTNVEYYLKRKYNEAEQFEGEWRNWHTRSA